MFFFHKMHEKRLAGWSFYGKKIKLKCKQVPGVICVLLLYTKMQCNSSPWHLAGCHCNIDKYVPLRCFFPQGKYLDHNSSYGSSAIILTDTVNDVHTGNLVLWSINPSKGFQVTKRKVSGLRSLAKYKSASTKGII
jgi:hypothetical protein